MEIQGTDGSKTRIKPNSRTKFGRKNLINSNDKSISRTHIAIDLISPPNSKNPRISIEVIGKNPVWIHTKFGGEKVITLKRFQKGELGFDDLFFVGRNPNFFGVKIVEDGDDLGENFGERLNFDDDDDLGENFGDDFGEVCDVDPIQEFGFLAIGHEFDQYPKRMIREIKNWDWFLNDPVGGSDDEDSGETKGKNSQRRKRKKTSGGDDDVDDEWTAESEGEELTINATKARKLKYRTRSKDPRTSNNNRTSAQTSSTTSGKEEGGEEYEDDNEEDQTLGGFIVDDEVAEDDEEDVGNEIDDDEEEEFVEDEDEMEE